MLQRIKQQKLHNVIVFSSDDAVLDGSTDREAFQTGHVVLVVWNPEVNFPRLCIKIECIACGGPVQKDGMSKPRRVAGLKGRKHVSAQKYRCLCCSAAGGKATPFDAKHPQVMSQQLPAFVAAQLGVVFTHSGAMDYEMLQHIAHDVTKGTSFQAACERMHTFLKRSHNVAELTYMDQWGYLQQPGQQTQLDTIAPSGPPPQFGQFGAPGMPKPYLPASQSCSTIWLSVFEDKAAYAKRHMSSLLGDFLSGDHTFRTAKYVRNTDGSAAYMAVLNFKNEYSQTVAYWFTNTTSMLEVKVGLQKLQQRYIAAGLQVNNLDYAFDMQL